MSTFDPLGIVIPAGYEVVETDRVVAGAPVAFYVLRWRAERARRAHDENAPLYRCVVQRTNENLPAGTIVPMWARWAVVAKQNRLRPRLTSDDHA